MKQEKLCESEDMTMEELGVENSRLDEVRERINMMSVRRMENVLGCSREEAEADAMRHIEREIAKRHQVLNAPWGPESKANDRQVGGDHYKNAGVEPWDVIDTWPEEQRIGAYRSGALKYIMRAGDKDPFKQDIAKAHHYLEKLLEILE